MDTFHTVELYQLSSSLYTHLAILWDQISNLINSENHDLINIINNTANIFRGTIIDIHNHLPEKAIKTKKAPGIDQINKKLITRINRVLSNFFTSFLTCGSIMVFTF